MSSTKIVTLSHVKVSTLPPASSTECTPRRIAWPGGKLTSNKEEALRKFYERKVLKGEALTPEQQQAVQTTLGIDVQTPPSRSTRQEHANKKTLIITTKKHKVHHHHHAKISMKQGNHKTITINGRVLGPKPAKHANTRKQQTRRAPSSASLAVQDKLEMSLDAIVKKTSQEA